MDLTGAFLCAQKAARIMVDAGTPGRIVNITLSTSTSRCLRRPPTAPPRAGWACSPRCMALGEHGITVNAIAPSEIATPMTGAHDVDPSDEERPALPLGRPAAHTIAALVAFLASAGCATPPAAFVTEG